MSCATLAQRQRDGANRNRHRTNTTNGFSAAAWLFPNDVSSDGKIAHRKGVDPSANGSEAFSDGAKSFHAAVMVLLVVF